MTLKDQLTSLSSSGRERVLDALGLEAKPAPSEYILPALGLFGAGLVCGAILGLMVAPKPGAELRQDIRTRIRRRRDEVEE